MLLITSLVSPFKGICHSILLFNEAQNTFFQPLYRLVTFPLYIYSHVLSKLTPVGDALHKAFSANSSFTMAIISSFHTFSIIK